jgi:hypothetical protein
MALDPDNREVVSVNPHLALEEILVSVFRNRSRDEAVIGSHP